MPADTATMPSSTGFLTLRGRANVAVALLVLSVIVSLLSILAERDIQSLIDAALAGQTVGIAEVDAADERIGLYALGGFVVLVASRDRVSRMVLPRVREHRTSRRERPAREQGLVGRVLVRPDPEPRAPEAADGRHLARERSRTPGRRFGGLEVGRRSTGLIHLWWAAFLIGELVSNIATRKIMAAETLAERRGAGQTDMLAEYIPIPAAILAILVVRAVTSRQEVRAAVLGAAGAIAAQKAAYEPPHPLTVENPSSFPPPALGA